MLSVKRKRQQKKHPNHILFIKTIDSPLCINYNDSNVTPGFANGFERLDGVAAYALLATGTETIIY